MPRLDIYLSEEDYLKVAETAARLSLSMTAFAKLMMTRSNLTDEDIKADALRAAYEKAQVNLAHTKMKHRVKPLFGRE